MISALVVGGGRRTARENLGAVWRNYARHGIDRLILVRVVESIDDVRRLVDEIPGAEVTVCQLRANAAPSNTGLRSRWVPAARWSAPTASPPTVHISEAFGDSSSTGASRRAAPAMLSADSPGPTLDALREICGTTGQLARQQETHRLFAAMELLM